MTESGITVQHLKKSYKKSVVLKDVSFEVQAGTIFALLGKNGAGKTTIINILTTLIQADGGQASINNIDVVKSPHKIREHISLTGQFAAVDTMLTARENLKLIADLRHVKNVNQIVEELLKRFDLNDAADRRVSTFSGGMGRRLDIAMSLIGTPSVIFLDEPTTGLDPEARQDMWHTIQALAKNGTTVFLTTQYLEEADQLADKIVVIDGGKVIAEGTASQLKAKVGKDRLELTLKDTKAVLTATKLLGKAVVDVNDTEHIVSLTINDINKDVKDVLDKLVKDKVKIVSLEVHKPTLDDVFLSLTGKQKTKQAEDK